MTISMTYEMWMWRFNDEKYKRLLHFSATSEPKSNRSTSPQGEQNNSEVNTYMCVCVTLLTSSSILFQPSNHPQSCPTKRNTRKSHLYYFICPVTSLLYTALRLQSSRMLPHVVGSLVPSTRLTPSLPHWRRRQLASADMVPIYRSIKCHITEDNIYKCIHFKSHIVRNAITLLGLWYWLYTKYAAIYKLKLCK